MISLSPEVLVEQVMGYAIWACELIPTLPANIDSYHIALLPQWPHFYTGLLQAAGYLLLENTKKEILIISQQSEYPHEIIVATNTYGPISGKKRKTTPKTVATITKALGAKWNLLSEDITFHVSCIQLITKIKKIIHIGMGTHVSPKQITTLATRIHQHKNIYNTVILTNIPLSSSNDSASTNEHKEITKSLTTSFSFAPCWSLFQELAQKDMTIPQIMAYVKPQKSGNKDSLAIRYGCIMQ